MADHSDPSPKHPHERPDHVPPSALPLLASTGRDTAVILLASATAVFLALAVALSLMLWRGRDDGTLAAGNASSRPPTPQASAAAQPVEPVPSDSAASAATEPEESAHAEETEATAESAEATAEASETAHAESTEATETEDPDAAAAEHETTTHSDELPITGSAAPLLITSGLALTLGGLTLTRIARRRVVAAGPEISAVEALRLLLSEPRDRDDRPQARHPAPVDQSARLSRVARHASATRSRQ